MDTKKAHLKTKHGFIFEVKVINEVGHTYFGCSNWKGLCKTYGFQEDMKITFDIGPEDDPEDIIDIWVDVDMIPILPSSYFLSSKHERKIVDATYYSYGLELTWKEKNALVSFVNDVQTFKINYEVSQNYSGYVPLVHELSDGNIRANSMKLPKNVVPQLMYAEGVRHLYVEGEMSIISLRPSPPVAFQSAY